MTQTAASVDPAEIERFSAMAAEWWDPQGKFRPLHKFNPVRLGFIRDRIAGHFGRDVTVEAPLSGLRLLDIGCGGGLVAEPMARLGASVVGADAAERNIGVARAHAAESGLEIDYRCTSAEALAAAGERFDVVLTLEVVEHVADLEGFLSCCGQMVKPGGLLIAATLNRTLKAYALAIVGAEYILGWLPRGTHDWKKFVQPHELAAGLRHAGLTMQDVTGVSYDPLADRWSISRDTDVNYMMVAVKDA
ncbi:bifunctional 2-polyprenyl-6-hydroxyphenol methylase/3-demethylubiquinol 3-O-methyltransferase UbiG [Ferrovibrio sp.]|uniref:bifunctional 2-polyprenyl-6-hydroxyphenol methylase/3-demethylubiquinol 3-O-methyltransferase UbiG n=1 Tax=Ferrovibrio sp. TaxID=1917215 RepID=UPI002614686C|nr:bifunctional 2-polyprenyl-6-hydroxyphenol methylase/3-demethylubiquinol 3-O-methyltransferase UbiG [Ferrovibrio sp.]